MKSVPLDGCPAQIRVRVPRPPVVTRQRAELSLNCFAGGVHYQDPHSKLIIGLFYFRPLQPEELSLTANGQGMMTNDYRPSANDHPPVFI
jgi:hypothetical protein